MNKKGMAALYFFMVGVIFFLLGLALAPALTDTTNQVMNSNNLDCSNTSISNQQKAICYQIDTLSPLYIGIIFGLGGIIFVRLVT